MGSGVKVAVADVGEGPCGVDDDESSTAAVVAPAALAATFIFRWMGEVQNKKDSKQRKARERE
jgi:hypothetical protein